MHVWRELLTRELFLFALLLAMGLGPVAFLPRRIDRATRLALAPAFGLAVGLCALTTALWRIPAGKSAWLILLVAAASVAVAAVMARRAPSDSPARAPWRIGWRSALQLALIVVVVLYAFDRPLHARHSVGPVAYAIADAAGYVAEEDGARKESIHAAATRPPPAGDLTLGYWHGVTASYQQIGFDSIAAETNTLLGLGASETYSSYIVVLILIAGLGVFAAVRVVVRSRSWAAALAGVLVAGPFWVQLFMDGSQGAIAGLALIVPLCVAGYLALRCRRVADFVLLALIAAGLSTAYPLFVPPIAAAAAIVLVALGARQLLRGGVSARAAGRAAGALFGVIVLGAALSPVAFERNVRYWKAILTGQQSFVGLPSYDLPATALPGWLLQTRQLYVLPHLDALTSGQIAASILVPLAIIAVIVFGIRAWPVALGAVVVLAVAAGLADYTWVHNQCSYCVQRNLLVVGPLGAASLGIGVAALAASPRWPVRLLAPVLAVIVLVAVLNPLRNTDDAVTNGSYVFDPQTRAALAHVPRLPSGALSLEGFGEGPKPQMETATVYHAAREAAGGWPSIPAEANDGNSMEYLGGPRPQGPEFDPNYRYVLTRLAGAAAGRQTVYRSGPVALERRTSPLDTLLVSGVSVAFPQTDPQGHVWIEGPIGVWVTGTRTGEPVWLDVEAQVTSQAGVGRARGVTAHRSGARLSVCVATQGPGVFRRVSVPFAVAPVPQPPPPGSGVWTVPAPPQGLLLLSLRATTSDCSGTARTAGRPPRR